jgi:hypothetical protein
MENVKTIGIPDKNVNKQVKFLNEESKSVDD